MLFIFILIILSLNILAQDPYHREFKNAVLMWRYMQHTLSYCAEKQNICTSSVKKKKKNKKKHRTIKKNGSVLLKSLKLQERENKKTNKPCDTLQVHILLDASNQFIKNNIFALTKNIFQVQRNFLKTQRTKYGKKEKMIICYFFTRYHILYMH